jgi:branched-subunit amino acid aminotransferase/4-amino-4-deoxychorismate lyase
VPLLNGAAVTSEQLQTLALTGYGHFTSMRVERGRVRGLSLHLDRLTGDCRTLFDAPLDPDRVRALVRQGVADSGITSLAVRVTVFDPDLDPGRPCATDEPSILVTTRPAGPTPLAPFTVRSTTCRRELPAVKHVGLMGALWSRRAAQLDGFDDALLVDEGGHVCEGATWNIGFFDGEQVVWPAAPALPGVTMRLLTRAHGRTATRPVLLQDVPRAQAAFATNAYVGVRPIAAAIDGVRLRADHDIVAVLRREYEEIPPETV